VPVYEKYPSSEFTFFQFGALKFSLSYLEEISEQHFVGPEDISRLKDELGVLNWLFQQKISLTELNFRCLIQSGKQF
jgi:hypothetical protein